MKVESSSPLNNQLVACAILPLCTRDTMHHFNKFLDHSRMVGNNKVTTTTTITTTTMCFVCIKEKR
jgi:hypothetical protein